MGGCSVLHAGKVWLKDRGRDMDRKIGGILASRFRLSTRVRHQAVSIIYDSPVIAPSTKGLGIVRISPASLCGVAGLQKQTVEITCLYDILVVGRHSTREIHSPTRDM
jgi:hypothetical protein